MTALVILPAMMLATARTSRSIGGSGSRATRSAGQPTARRTCGAATSGPCSAAAVSATSRRRRGACGVVHTERDASW